VWAVIQEARGEIVLFTDMDQSTPVSELSKLSPWYEKGSDVVIGSRGTAREGFSILRGIGSTVFRGLRRLFLLRDISITVSPSLVPDLSEEYMLRAGGHTHVADPDEAGRGAWTGPVCAAAVVLPLDRPDLPDRLTEMGGTKQLMPTRRDAQLLCPSLEDTCG
jgi:hypothetical protein